MKIYHNFNSFSRLQVDAIKPLHLQIEAQSKSVGEELSPRDRGIPGAKVTEKVHSLQPQAGGPSLKAAQRSGRLMGGVGPADRIGRRGQRPVPGGSTHPTRPAALTEIEIGIKSR